MWKFKYCLILICCIMWTKSKTVRYTLTPTENYSQTDNYNTVQSITKTYELQVPGSNPIKIIESDQPLWSNSILRTTTEPIPTTSKEHRSFRSQKKFKFSERAHDIFTTQKTKTTLSEPLSSCYGPSCDNQKDSVEEKRSEFAATDLNKFIEEYTKRFNIPDRKTEKPFLEKVSLIEAPTKNYSKGYIDKSKASWDSYEDKGQKNPYDERHGWVTLEAVPWSTSKVSKWESNNKNTHWSDSSNSRPFWNNKPNYYEDKTNFDMRPLRPNNYNDDRYGGSSGSNYRPSWDKNSDYEPSPPNSWPKYDNRYPSNSPNTHYHDKDCNRVHGDLITDGQPGNFPTQPIGFMPYSDSNRYPPQPIYDSRPSSSNYQHHPQTYPDSGDGQWVLLSTTKGYQYPKKRQRSLEINPAVLSARKSVHLTVLPALNGSDVNMTTSHGGLLQVDSSFETVDDARKSYIRKLKLNATRKPNRINRRPLKPVTQQHHQQQQTSSNSPDTTAVLAAVGAGMVPATMAMVMPMVLGRKRRSLNKIFGDKNNYVPLHRRQLTVTQLPGFSYRALESTLQRSL